MSSTASDPAGAQTIVLIHGMWMTPLSWEHGSSHYSDCGPAQARACVAWARGRARTATPRSVVAPKPKHHDVVDHYGKNIRVQALVWK